MRCGTCDITGDVSQWGQLQKAPAGNAAPAEPGQVTMESWIFLVLALDTLIHYLQPVADGFDEETLRLHLELRAKRIEEERIRLERELEQLRLLEQSSWAWGDLLVSALQHWQLWAFAGLLVLLAVWFMWRERSLRREEHEEQNNGANEEDDVGNEVIHVAANAQNNNDANEVEDDQEFDDNIGRIVMERIQWPVQDLEAGCEWTTNVMDDFINYAGRVLANRFYPMLERAIGFGSAFEGWSPREEDVVYRFLVPMTPPQGHSFHLEMSTARRRHVRNFRVRVELECTCTREQQAENILCFLHHPEEELRSNQDASLLHTLCTGSYLDVQKTARWFYVLLRAIWPALPQSHNWQLVLLPYTRSCQFKVTNGGDSFRIEMLFGVQRGDSDIFVSSQSRELLIPSTWWPEMYDVAEVKFFRHIARQAPPDSLHLRCLQFFTRLQLGLGFSTYTTKTIVMHLLNTLPVSQWRRRDFVRRVLDIDNTLRSCLLERRLNHFIVGNRRLPEVIALPQDVPTANSFNLFHHLLMNPVAHSYVMSNYIDLRHSLRRVLYGHN